MFVSCNLLIFLIYFKLSVSGLFLSKNPVRRWLDSICKAFALCKFQVAQTACEKSKKSKKSCSSVADAVLCCELDACCCFSLMLQSILRKALSAL